MMKLLGILLLALGLVVVAAQMPLQSQPVGSPIIPTTVANVALNPAAGTRLVIAGVAGQRTYVTAAAFAAAATSTLRVMQGTGGTCGTGTVDIVSTITFAAEQTWSFGSGNGALWVLVPGNSLCTVVGVASIGGFMSYTQF